MKGKIGTPMVIEYAPKKKKRGKCRQKEKKCKECEYLKWYGTTQFPYICSLKHKGRHWTSKCVCNRFKKKEDNV